MRNITPLNLPDSPMRDYYCGLPYPPPGWSLHFKVEISVIERMRGTVYREHSAQWLDQDSARSLLTIIFSQKGDIFGKLLPSPVM